MGYRRLKYRVNHRGLITHHFCSCRQFILFNRWTKLYRVWPELISWLLNFWSYCWSVLFSRRLNCWGFKLIRSMFTLIFLYFFYHYWLNLSHATCYLVLANQRQHHIFHNVWCSILTRWWLHNWLKWYVGGR